MNVSEESTRSESPSLIKRFGQFVAKSRQSESTPSSPQNTGLLSRRDFLEKGVHAGGALGVAAIDKYGLLDKAKNFAEGIDALQPKEEEPHSITDNVTYIDILSNYDFHAFAEKHLGAGFQEFSEQLLQASDRNQFIAESLYDERAPYALMQLYMDSYSNMQGSLVFTDGQTDGLGHDELVTGTGQYLYDQAGWKTGTPQILPLQESVSQIEAVQSEEEIPALEITIDGDLIIQQLKDVESPIINMSFQLGTFEFSVERMPRTRPKNYFSVSDDLFTTEEFDDVEYPLVFLDDEESEAQRPIPFVTENGVRRNIPLFTREELNAQGFKMEDEYEPVRTSIQEAYSPEHALASFRELMKVCAAFPDKLFINSSGNFNSFSAEQRAQLAAEWPSNLIMTGFGPISKEADGFTEHYWLFGNNISDVYLPYSYVQSSSESAAVISALASVVHEKYPHFTAEEIKRMILEPFTTTEIINGKTVRWLDVQKMEYYLQLKG